MDISVNNQTGELSLYISGEDVTDQYMERILSENVIDGLLPVRIINMDGESGLSYDISSNVSLEKRFAGRFIGYDEIKTLILSLTDMSGRLLEFLLPKEGLLLSANTIFYDESRQKYEYCLYIANKDRYCSGVKELVSFLLRRVDHHDERAREAVYKMFDIIGRDAFSEAELRAGFLSEEESADYIIPEKIQDERTPPEEKANDEEYFAETPPSWLYENTGAKQIKLRQIAAFAIPILGLAFLIILFVAGAFTALPLWMKIVCPTFAEVSLILIGAIVYPDK